MPEKWEYQLRFKLSPELAEIARRDVNDERFKPIAEVLARHNASATSQFDAFAHYVAEAEKHGVDNYPLYQWTKATIENPERKPSTLRRSLSMSTARKSTTRLGPMRSNEICVS